MRDETLLCKAWSTAHLLKRLSSVHTPAVCCCYKPIPNFEFLIFPPPYLYTCRAKLSRVVKINRVRLAPLRKLPSSLYYFRQQDLKCAYDLIYRPCLTQKAAATTILLLLLYCEACEGMLTDSYSCRASSCSGLAISAVLEPCASSFPLVQC